MKYHAKINEHFQINISGKEIKSLDVIKGENQSFHIVRNGKSYKAQVMAVDFSKKIFNIKINGREYQLYLKDEIDQLVSKLGLEISTSNKLGDIKAPMPGLVIDIAVNPGQEIKKGDKLLILEAMKMENVIKSDGEGIVKAVHINKGIAVDKGQLLIEME